MNSLFRQKLQRLAFSTPAPTHITLLVKGMSVLSAVVIAASGAYCMSSHLESAPGQRTGAAATYAIAAPKDFTQQLSTVASVENLVVLLQAYSQSQHVDVVSLDRLPLEDTQGLTAAPFELHLKGAYPAVKSVLASVLAQTPGARVTRLKLDGDETASVVNASVSLTVWCRDKVPA